MTIRNAMSADAHAVAAIYNHYVLHTSISFEEEAVSADEMAGRIRDVQQKSLPWLVCEENDVVIGYAYATPWRVRKAYRFSVETSVYLMDGRGGQGHGARLYRMLFERLTDSGYHLAIGGIALPNDASVALHQKMGFEKVAQFKEVGLKFGQWNDVGYWQRTLSRDMRDTVSGP